MLKLTSTGTILAIVAGIFLSPLQALATTVDDLTDQPTSLLVATASNHKITLTLTAAVSEAETVTLTFPADFDTSTLTEDDIDIVYDGNEVITDVACGGSVQTGVVISGDVITVTRCMGAGAFTVSKVVEVEIGTNASAHGSGTHQVTNPSTAGTYYLAIGGSSGNVGSLPLPIGTRSGANVSVNLTGGSGPEEEGDDGGGDDPPPDPDPEPECGDDICESPETANSCPSDCADEPPPEPVCGDNVCESPETVNSCPADCAVDPDPEPEPEPDPEPEPEPSPDPEPEPGPDTTPDSDDEAGNESAVSLQIDLYAGSNLLLDGDDGQVDVLSSTQTRVVVSVSSDTAPTSVLLVIGDQEYVLSSNSDGTFSGFISTPGADDVLVALALFADGSESSENLALDVVGGGSVYEVIENERVLLSGSVLTVYDSSTGREVAWNASIYGQLNPLLTNSGYFSWYVPNGTYVVYANKSGYLETSVTVRVTNNILAANIELTREPEVVLPLPEFIAPQVTAVINTVENVLQSPEAAAVADVALPVTIALATGTLTALAIGFNLLAYLQYLFTSPLLLFGRRKRRTFGVVYNAITKVPIELATVRVYSSPDNRLVKSVVTSPEGKYSLAVNPGEYKLVVSKSGYIFPSEYLKDVKADGKYLDVYTGQILVVNEKDALIAANVPVDPSEAGAFHAPRSLAFKRFARSLQLLMAPLGVVISIGVYVVQPSVFAAVMIGVQCLVLLLVLRLAKARKPKGWGIVYDESTHRPVGNTVIRVFEPKYNKLVETALSDSLGRYSFLLGPNEYFVTYNKPGYTEKIVRPIDYTNKPEPAPLAMNVALQHVSGEQHVSAR